MQLAEQAQKELAAQDVVAQTTLSKALALWPANELAKRLQPEAANLKAAAVAVVDTPAAPVATPVPAATPQPRAVVADVPQVESEKPFLLTIGGMITVVVFLALVFAAWTVFKKIKSRASDILE
jgi:hypothetical protein